MDIYTLGHSTLSLTRFLALLAAHEIEVVADVRSFPGSRRHPHFAREPLAAAVAAAGRRYEWLPGLGGRRRRRPGSPHTAWQEPGFAAYADHLDTEEFRQAAAALLAIPGRVAVMCAEALPHRCHRRVLSDWLVTRGVTVRHILSPTRLDEHRLPPFARVVGDRLVYDGGQGELDV